MRKIGLSNLFMRITNFFFTFLLSVLIAIPVIAQDEGYERKPGNKSSLRIEDADDEQESEKLEGYKSAIKTNLLSNVYGMASLTYDYAFHDNFSLSFTGGYSYTNLITSAVYPFLTLRSPIDGDSYYVDYYKTSDERIIYKPTFVYRIGIKNYFDPDAFQEGAYWGFELGRFVENSNFSYYVIRNQEYEERESGFLKTRMTDFRLYYGRQGRFGKSRIIYDIHMSGGVSLIRKNLLKYDYNDKDFTTPIIQKNVRGFSPRFAIGLSLGYCF